MNYPLISEYIEAIQAAEDNFKELTNLRPVLGDDGQPVMTSGNFAVVFKMQDVETGKYYALKCFTKKQEGRGEAYRLIAEELKNVESPYITSIRYLDKELFVDTDQTTETEFPVLLMDWVEGKTLDKYLRENLDDKYALEMLAYRFSQLAQWLIPQPFAHGDLKPDNILVREDGTLVLVDYDGMYVPAMKGQKARELGSPDFRHPLRTENDFDEHIDDFPLVSILLSIKTLSITIISCEANVECSRLLFSYSDYLNIMQSEIIRSIFPSKDSEINSLVCILSVLCQKPFPVTLPYLAKPQKININEWWKIKANDILSTKSISDENRHLIDEDDLVYLDIFLRANNITDYIITGTMGLRLYGLTPESYIVHDIDIRIYTSNIEDFWGICYLMEKIQIYCDEESPNYGDSKERKYSFKIGSFSVSVNAFVYPTSLEDHMYRSIIVKGRNFKIANCFEILKSKYGLRRLKDYQFHLILESIFAKMFEEKTGNSSE